MSTKEEDISLILACEEWIYKTSFSLSEDTFCLNSSGYLEQPIEEIFLTTKLFSYKDSIYIYS